MPRKADPVQAYFEVDVLKGMKICKFCRKTYVLKTNTLNLQTHIQSCNKTPYEMKMKLSIAKKSASATGPQQRYTGTPATSLSPTNESAHVTSPTYSSSSSPFPTAGTSSTCSTSSTQNVSTLQSALDSRPGCSSAASLSSQTCDEFLQSVSPVDLGQGPSKPKYQKIDDAFFNLLEKQGQFKQDMSKMIFGMGMPISILDHHLMQELFSKYLPSLPLPDRKTVSCTILDSEYKYVEEEVTKRLNDSTSVAIQWDSYTNIRREPVINIVVTTPTPVLFRTLHPGMQSQTAEYMAKQISDCIKDIGPYRVVGGVTDNCAAMIKARKLLMAEYEHLMFWGCVDHIISLLMQDVCKTQFLTQIMSNISELIREVNDGSLKAWFTSIQKEKGKNVSLKKASKTRFTGNALTMKSFIANEMIFKQMAIDKHPLKPSISLKATSKTLVLNENFWSDCQNVNDMFVCFLKWVTILESDKPYISLVIEAFKDIEQHILQYITECSIDVVDKEMILKAIEDRKDMAITKMHFAANLLDISYRGSCLSGEEKLEAMDFVLTLAKSDPRFTADDIKTIQSDISSYVSETGLWEKPYLKSLIEGKNSMVHWRTLTGITPLAIMAIKILNMPATSAATERSFSAHGFIHNKRRNRLLNERAAKLLYIKFNYKYLDVHIKSAPIQPPPTFRYAPSNATKRNILPNLSPCEGDNEEHQDSDDDSDSSNFSNIEEWIPMDAETESDSFSSQDEDDDDTVSSQVQGAVLSNPIPAADGFVDCEASNSSNTVEIDETVVDDSGEGRDKPDGDDVTQMGQIIDKIFNE